MAKHTTTQCRKFKAALKRLSIPGPHLLGHLEYIWQSAHIEGDPVFASAEEIEIAAEWSGEPGALATALIETGWLDSREDGQIEVHDYWDHAPKYVQERERLRVKRSANKFQQIPTNSNNRQQTAKCWKMLDTTYTYTDTQDLTSTEIKIADKDSPLIRARARGGDPESLGCLAESAIDLTAQEAEWWGRVSSLVEDYALPWWQATMRAYLEAGGNGAELEELVRRYEDATSPAMREAKGVGEFTKVNGAARALMKDMTRLCKRVGARWGKYPEEGE